MLTVAEVERIAQLGRLALGEEEKVRYARQLSAVLDYAAQLENVDVEGIPPTASVLTVHSVMREGDVVDGSLDRKDVLANAPSTNGESFIVQATLDNGE
jgi:aspartyl-tRNA(Asn)/glutamyl-tRNA(Gln) amidotransferase subunit C